MSGEERVSILAKEMTINVRDNATVEVIFKCNSQAEANKLFEELNSEIKLGKLDLRFDAVPRK